MSDPDQRGQLLAGYIREVSQEIFCDTWILTNDVNKQ
jgi:hypothetical protein